MVLLALPACYVARQRVERVQGAVEGQTCLDNVHRTFTEAGFVRVDGVSGGLVVFTPLASINTRSFSSGLRWGIGLRYLRDPLADGACDLEIQPVSYDEECPPERVHCEIGFQPGAEFARGTDEMARRLRVALRRGSADE